ncbi:response regulator [bacterium]|nr:response regulator [bacterium]
MKPIISIVYSEMHVLQSLDKMFIEAGFVTHSYYSPEEALKWAPIRKPDLYLINYKNIHMNGVEFYKKLNEMADYYALNLRAVFISSKEETKQECLDAGGLDFIDVPFEPVEVIKRIRKALEDSKKFH